MLVKTIELEVFNALNLFADNFDTVKLRHSGEFASVEEFVFDLVSLSSDKGFYITDQDLKDKVSKLITLPRISTSNFSKSHTPKDETDLNRTQIAKAQIFEELSMKYYHFNQIKPKGYDTYKSQVMSQSATRLDANIKSKLYHNNSLINKTEPFIRRNMFPGSISREHMVLGVPFISLYIDVIVKFANIRYNEEIKKTSQLGKYFFL